VTIEDIHHLGLTVRDTEASAAWYVRVLGFERVGGYEAPAGERTKVFLRHPGLQARLGLVQHRAGAPDSFDETRVGLDHLAFRVADRAALDTWARRLAEVGVTATPVTDSLSIDGAAVLVFRDPDNIQLELFADPASAASDNVCVVRGLTPSRRSGTPWCCLRDVVLGHAAVVARRARTGQSVALAIVSSRSSWSSWSSIIKPAIWDTG
jgi:glyoxylase I family protein